MGGYQATLNSLPKERVSFSHFLVWYLISGSSFPPWCDNYEILNKVSSFLQQINEQKAPITMQMFPKAPAEYFLTVYPTNHTASPWRARNPLYPITSTASMCVRVCTYLKRGLRSNMELITSHHKITFSYQFQVGNFKFPNAMVQIWERKIPTCPYKCNKTVLHSLTQIYTNNTPMYEIIFVHFFSL